MKAIDRFMGCGESMQEHLAGYVCALAAGTPNLKIEPQRILGNPNPQRCPPPWSRSEPDRFDSAPASYWPRQPILKLLETLPLNYM